MVGYYNNPSRIPSALGPEYIKQQLHKLSQFTVSAEIDFPREMCYEVVEGNQSSIFRSDHYPPEYSFI